MAENIWFKYEHIITAIFKFYKSETKKYIKINDSHFQITLMPNNKIFAAIYYIAILAF